MVGQQGEVVTTSDVEFKSSLERLEELNSSLELTVGGNMIDWICWKLKIGWKLGYRWIGDRYIEECWVNRKTNEVRHVRR
jgi:hypothetical protein